MTMPGEDLSFLSSRRCLYMECYGFWTLELLWSFCWTKNNALEIFLIICITSGGGANHLTKLLLFWVMKFAWKYLFLKFLQNSLCPQRVWNIIFLFLFCTSAFSLYVCFDYWDCFLLSPALLFSPQITFPPTK